MKKCYRVIYLFLSLLLILNACEEKEPIIEEQKVDIVSRFAYDGMSSLYLWNHELIGKEPTINDNDPKKYFYGILNETDAKYGWSWITDDAEELRAGFAGEPKTFGYALGFTRIGGTIFAFVKYVYENTPAADAGLKRLDFIGEVNGKPITADADGYIDNVTLEALYGNNSTMLTIYNLTEDEMVEKNEVTIAPRTEKTNPVLYTNIYKEGDRTIGYLIYNSFIGNFNNKLYEAFSEFKNEGVNELILDLRYNSGGDMSAAQYLASMIAPEEDVKNKATLGMFNYNEELGNDYFKLGIYPDTIPNPIDANLNLQHGVHIIATNDSYSASELVTFCLREFLPVVHIGSKTGGKYTGSTTVHPFDKDLGFPLYLSEFFPDKHLASVTKERLANWALQPIIAIYTNNKGDNFAATDGLLPDIEMTEGFGFIDYWAPFGDTKDVLLGRALYEITGNEDYKPVQPKITRGSDMMLSGKIKVKGIGIADEIRKGSVIIDSFTE